MNKRSVLVASVAASLLLGIAGASAAPHTAYVEGITAVYFDNALFDYVPDNVGQPFSARLVFDVDNGPLYVSLGTDFSTVIVGATRGCDRIVNGMCTSDSGAALPIVTDYSVIAPFAPPGGYRPIPTSDYLFDLTARQNIIWDGAFLPQDDYIIERGQGRVPGRGVESL